MFGKTINAFQALGAILAGVAVIGLSSCSTSPLKEAEAPAPSAATAQRQRTLLDADWTFHRGDVSALNQVIATNYDDSEWPRVQLPHDYVLDGSYTFNEDRDHRTHGYLPLEVAWYRKRFVIPKSDQGRSLQLEFGGIYRDSQVWLNGLFLGSHPGGYTGFYLDITKAARYGAENVVAVRVDPRQAEGHWYEGGGIYRHVYYHATAPVHVANYGTYVISKVPDGNLGAHAVAELTLQTTLENKGLAPANCAVVSEILGPDGALLLTVKSAEVVPTEGLREVTQHALLEHPQLWSLDSPQLYQLRTTILQQGRPVDCARTTFGIRTICFDADKGFFLNGQHVQIRGVANHQDFPGVGIAVPDSLQPWRVKQLKQMGCNGWRTAHNEPNESVLDACDRQGMLVMAENRHFGDSYRQHSQTGTTYTNLSDLATMIQHDRNHPSIIMWSLCNEEGLRGKAEGARIFSAMKEVVHRYDSTRPVTCAINGTWLTNGIADEDIIGVNYHDRDYDNIHRANPRVAMFGSETANLKTTRGEYLSDSTNGWVNSYNLFNDKLPAMSSSGMEAWTSIASRPFMAGSFTWTGFDYKGEPNPYGWPDISNNTGLMDVCGFPKDKYYYLEACWSDKPMVHLMPMTWKWPGKEGQNIRVIAFSNAREVELFLHGKSLGAKTMPRAGRLEWQVPYSPGQLTAKARTNGRVIATDRLETTGAPARIQLSPDRTILQADGQDTLVVPVSILDAKGRVVPDANNRVSFQLNGGGRILGVGNGNPSDHDPDRANQRKAFHGHCIVIIQAGSNPEVLRLTAASPGLTSARLEFRVR
jgi:beta-galactosidase